MTGGHGHLFNNITVGGRGGTNPGQIKIHPGGIVWKRQGGGKSIEVDKADIMGVTWMKVPRSNQLGVQIKDGLFYKFTGFRDQDVVSLTDFFQNMFGIAVEEKKLSVSGRNWGEVDLNGNMLGFMVGSKQAFEVSLADVSQTHLQGKNDVLLEFHVDDTTGANEKDSLVEISFHIPNSNTQYVGDENHPPAQVFRDKIMSMADVGAGGEDAVVTFEGIAILTPRGRYSVELHLSFLRLQGQANDFKIQYSSIVRIFLLPKSNQPHTFVIISLDPPIRKGQTLYPHIVMQFETDLVEQSELAINEDLYNTKYKDKLELSYKGLIHEVFTTILRGLSGSKVTKPGTFRSCLHGYAVKSSLKAEDGILYPLEKGFFFLPKPPTLILHDEIDYVEFERGGTNMHYFDLLIRLKSEQEHLFRNIQRNEYDNLLSFIRSKSLKIMNLGGAQPTVGMAQVLENDHDDAVDPHLERIKNEAGGDESDEEDEDFVVDKDDGGSPTDESGGEDSDASDSGDEKEKPAKVEPKKVLSSKASNSKRKSKDADEDGKKKKQKKKDPNAPKRAMSGFMFFSQMERENLKKTNPGISFTDVGRVLGEKWKKISAEDKEPYEAKARADRKRYMDEISGYKNPQPMNVDSGNESDSA
ncbi:FACT complex subunit SSRP1-like [Lotus japonicus]|uniref:FACT complex subunit SSRP1-like n=1 Tax=Lotus japonicus TaxID=34305 RepID=UPI00258543C8|nr:FACT complex subunit SSRP1-like [Lotus japonicus]XP_057445609.1 FACT complex subunit SSRP1-like [Lotus japonicus]